MSPRSTFSWVSAKKMNEQDILAFAASLVEGYYFSAQLCYEQHIQGWFGNLESGMSLLGAHAIPVAVQARITDHELRGIYARLVEAMGCLVIADQHIMEWLGGSVARRGKGRTASLHQRLKRLERGTVGPEWGTWAERPEYQPLLAESEAALIAVIQLVAQFRDRLLQLRPPVEGKPAIIRPIVARAPALDDDWSIETSEADALLEILRYAGIDLGYVEVSLDLHRRGRWSGLFQGINDIGRRRIFRALFKHIRDEELKADWTRFREILQKMRDIDQQIFQWLMAWAGVFSLATLPLESHLPLVREKWDYQRMYYKYQVIDQTCPSDQASRVAQPEYQSLLAQSEAAAIEAKAAKQDIEERVGFLLRKMGTGG